jgi:ASCH domain
MTIQNLSIDNADPCSPVIPWTPGLDGLSALSVRQPWAWLIVSGLKDIENRPRRTHHRGPLLIHAGLSLDSCTLGNIEWLEKKYGIHIPRELDTGGIVGVVNVTDCVESHESKWFNKGNYGWVLANPRRLEFRECRGALGIFRPKSDKMTMSAQNK